MCKSSLRKTKRECKADRVCVSVHMWVLGVPCVCVCVCVCVRLLHVSLGVREVERKAQTRLEACASVTPDCVWTMHSNTIFTFCSTFLKHPESSIRV